jgi:DNA polymerase III sliding clamp (beta) subunit (PCNA family)
MSTVEFKGCKMTSFEMYPFEIKRLIDRVRKAVPRKGGRTCRPVIKFELSGNKLRASASDGYRIAVADAMVLPDITSPNYEKVLARNTYRTEVQFSANALRGAVLQLQHAIDPLNPRLKFEISKRGVTLSSGTAKTRLPDAIVTGKRNVVELNPSLFNEYLDQVASNTNRVLVRWPGTVTMSVNTASLPVKFIDDSGYIYLVAPLRSLKEKAA